MQCIEVVSKFRLVWSDSFCIECNAAQILRSKVFALVLWLNVHPRANTSPTGHYVMLCLHRYCKRSNGISLSPTGHFVICFLLCLHRYCNGSSGVSAVEPPAAADGAVWRWCRPCTHVAPSCAGLPAQASWVLWPGTLLFCSKAKAKAHLSWHNSLYRVRK